MGIKRVLGIAIILSCLLLSFNCENKNDSIHWTSFKGFPVGDCNKWNHGYGAIGEEIQSRVLLNFDRYFEEDGLIWYGLTRTIEFSGSDLNYWSQIAFDQDGIVLSYNSSVDSIAFARGFTIILPYPANVEDKLYNVTVLSTDEVVDTPIGEFTNCIKYRNEADYLTSIGLLSVDYFLKPSIGFVKFVRNSLTPSARDTINLRSYELDGDFVGLPEDVGLTYYKTTGGSCIWYGLVDSKYGPKGTNICMADWEEAGLHRFYGHYDKNKKIIKWNDGTYWFGEELPDYIMTFGSGGELEPGLGCSMSIKVKVNGQLLAGATYFADYGWPSEAGVCPYTGN